VTRSPIQPITDGQRAAGLADRDDAHLKLWRQRFQHAVNFLRVVGVHHHRRTPAGAAFANGVQGLKTAQVCTQQIHTTAFVQRAVQTLPAVGDLHIKSLQVAAHKVDTVEHDAGESVDVAVAVAPTCWPAQRAAQETFGMAARRAGNTQVVQRDRMQDQTRHRAPQTHRNPRHQAQRQHVALFAACGP
jgi:hypothetical protein